MRVYGLSAGAISLIAAGLLLAQPSSDVTIPERVAWFAKNASILRTIDPHDEDYSDLRPVQRSIGSARIVLLGGGREVDTVKAKYRMVRFLHEEMGFDVLSTPEGMFECSEIDRSMDNGGGGSMYFRNIVDRGVFSGFEPSKSVRLDVLEYIHRTHKKGRPLHLAGEGSEFAQAMPPEFPKRLFQFMDAIDPHLASASTRKALRELVNFHLMSMPSPSPPMMAGPVIPGMRVIQQRRVMPPAYDALTNLYEALGQVQPGRANAAELSFYRQTLATYAVSMAHLSGRRTPRIPNSVVLLAKEWRPESKIIVWSDNISVYRFGSPVRASLRQVNIEGNVLANEFGPAVYSIAVTETRSPNEVLEVLVAGPQPALVPSDDHLESLLHATGNPYSFLNLRGLPRDHWLWRPVGTRGGGPEISWPDTYDAVIGIDVPNANAKKTAANASRSK